MTPSRAIAPTTRVVLCAAALACAGTSPPATRQPPSPQRAGSPEKKVLVIGVDGVRIDVLRSVRLPAIEALIADDALRARLIHNARHRAASDFSIDLARAQFSTLLNIGDPHRSAE